MSKRTKTFISVGGIFAILAIAVFFFISAAGPKSQPATTAPPPKPVEFVNPTIDTIQSWDEYSGRFEASQRVDVRARVGGFIDRVHFRDGQIVKKGQVLYTIDQRPFQIEVDRAKADLLQARTALLQSENNFSRVENLKESGAVSLEEYDQREQAVSVARAQVQSMETRVRAAELELSWTQVKAPITGRISRDLVNAGNIVSGGNSNATVLTSIVATSPLYFYFSVPEDDYLRYARQAPGSGHSGSVPVRVELADENGFSHTGSVDFVNNEVNRSTGAMQFRATFKNDDGLLEPGLYGRAQFLSRPDYPATMIPDKAIGTNQTVKFVYTIGADSTVQVTPIEPGRLYKGSERIVTSGLAPDARVITSNLGAIAPGMKVAPRSTASSSTSPAPAAALK
ncbi:efflux RND transporter periplasmic adaptor subunit [Neolewinella aurantiaca]|uniref:Efflux RND transporter periplasmic adaptor subunit n=1 Tax=Neolewinella aurantiaca TaxID=2602767 RepID=A0A5C7FH09_9BACT|nr:efflux RND transporter periplasmic adaptor subunit [Neolewinella aurantiaca]TXF88927.1 efflux RND transporter periplasmic adaptor subunit [Neolewinella aurantiaca]